jgi:polysaccharide biosynthesis protein PslG
MKKFSFVGYTLAIVLFLTVAAPLSQSQDQNQNDKQPPVPGWFFEMTAHWYNPWPAVPLYGVRLWNTGTAWSDINTADGVYDWQALDGWLAAAQKNHADELLYTLALTPSWASSNPNDASCKHNSGACDPPNDLNPDGSGTDQHWKDFVTAIATHAAGRIRFWEVWNEPVMPFFWNGTQAQMVRMAKDARAIILSIDPNAKMMNAGGQAHDNYMIDWWKNYAAAGGFEYADIIAFHGYVNNYPFVCGDYPKAADLVGVVNTVKSIVPDSASKPIWDTEASWGDVKWGDCFTDPDLRAAFLAQFYMMHRSLRVRRFYWFAYDDDETGGLIDPSTGKLNVDGIAYKQVDNWMLGNTLTQDCSATGTTWTCGFEGPNGYQAEVIWDTGESCGNGACQTTQYAVNSSFTQYRTLGGDTVAIQNSEVPIGAKPIIVENKTRKQ